MLESGLQAAAASWASLLCVYMVSMAIQDCMLSISNEFPIYRRSSLEGQGPPNAYIGGGDCPPPPHCSTAPDICLLEQVCTAFHGPSLFSIGLL